MACLLQALYLLRKDSTLSDAFSTVARSDASFTVARSDASSTLARSDASSTQTCSPDLFDYTEVDGRKYCNYSEAKHCHPLPSDEREEERLAIQHALCLQALRGRLILAPIRAAQQNILDVETGFGIWATCFADRHPLARVIGMNLTPIQPTSVPPNCKFQIHDAERLWNFTTPFKLVHLNHADTWVRDWCMIARQAFEALGQGGWIELKLDLPWEYDTSTPHHTAILGYHQGLVLGARAMGITLHQDGTFYRRLLHDVGFINFQEKKLYLDSTSMRKLHHEEGLNTFGNGYMGRGLQMGPAELQVRLAMVRKALRDPTLEIQFPVSVCYAQKPLGGVKGWLKQVLYRDC